VHSRPNAGRAVVEEGRAAPATATTRRGAGARRRGLGAGVGRAVVALRLLWLRQLRPAQPGELPGAAGPGQPARLQRPEAALPRRVGVRDGRELGHRQGAVHRAGQAGHQRRAGRARRRPSQGHHRGAGGAVPRSPVPRGGRQPRCVRRQHLHEEDRKGDGRRPRVAALQQRGLHDDGLLPRRARREAPGQRALQRHLGAPHHAPLFEQDVCSISIYLSISLSLYLYLSIYL